MASKSNPVQEVQDWQKKETKKGLVDVKLFVGDVSTSTTDSLSKEFMEMISTPAITSDEYKENFNQKTEEEILASYKLKL